MALLHELYGEIQIPNGRVAINFEEKEAHEQKIADQEAYIRKLTLKKAKAGVKIGAPAAH